MKKLYTTGKLKSFAVVLALALSANTFAQTSTCGGIVENFNNTGGSTVGFTGSFIYAMNGADGYLTKDRVIGGISYSLTTPTYRLPSNATSVGYGFELDGAIPVGDIRATIIYVAAANNEIVSYDLGSFSAFYPSPGASVAICRSVSTQELPGGISAGGGYRLQFTFKAGTGSGQVGQNFNFDDFRTNGTLSQAPLPVTFISLDSRKVSVGVQLDWKVAGEENVVRYEVERSTDGRNFTYIGTVATSKTDNYTYVDAANNSVVYYRVKNVDANGRFKYSSVVRYSNGKSDIVIKAFPQPVVGQLTLQHPAITEGGLVTISTADGRQVKSVRPALGSIQTVLDMSSLQKGMYVVRIDTGSGNAENIKVMKQ